MSISWNGDNTQEAFPQQPRGASQTKEAPAVILMEDRLVSRPESPDEAEKHAALGDLGEISALTVAWPVVSTRGQVKRLP